MKAIDLIKVMCYDPGIASGCTMEYSEESSIGLKEYFGATGHEGEMSSGTYFYFYVEPGQKKLDGVGMPAPDVVVETADAGNVLLWRIE